MANHTKKIESEQQEWDMEFKDPFSLDDDELAVYCSGSISRPPVMTTTFSESRLTVKTSNDVFVQRMNVGVSSSLQTITRDNKPATSGLESINCKANFQQCQLETNATACSNATVSVGERKQMQPVNKPVTPFSENLSHDTKIKSSGNEAEEQSPIPVMLSSAKRFCASEDIEKSQTTKQSGAYFRLPSPSAVLSNSRSCFALSAYPPNAYNIPAWPAASLPASNSGTGVQIPPVAPYNNCIPYSAIMSHPTNIPMLYNQSSIHVTDDTGTAHWPESRLQLQNILSKPPPPVSVVNHAAVLGLPASNFAVHTPPVRQLQNGLTSHRLPLATVPQVIPLFSPPNINANVSSHSVLLLSQQSQPHNTISDLAKSSLPVVSSVGLSAGQIVPHGGAVVSQHLVPLSTIADVSTSSSSNPPMRNTQCNNKHPVPNDKASQPPEQLRCSQSVTRVTSSTVVCTGLPVSKVCPPVTSSAFASKETVTLPLSWSNIPSPKVKCSSTFAQLDPRINNGHRQNAGAASQIPSSANAASSQNSAFVVPLPPPLPSLEELTAERSEDSQTDDNAATVGTTTTESTTSSFTATDSAKPDGVISSDIP